MRIMGYMVHEIITASRIITGNSSGSNITGFRCLRSVRHRAHGVFRISGFRVCRHHRACKVRGYGRKVQQHDYSKPTPKPNPNYTLNQNAIRQTPVLLQNQRVLELLRVGFREVPITPTPGNYNAIVSEWRIKFRPKTFG